MADDPNREVERILLGTAMQCPGELAEIRQIIQSAAFTDLRDGELFGALLNHVDSGGPPEPAAIYLAMVKAKVKVDNGYIADLWTKAVPGQGAWYARIIAKAAKIRYARELNARIAQAATDGDIDRVEQAIAEAADGIDTAAVTDRRYASELATELMRQRARREARRIIDAEEAAELPDIPEPTFLTDLLAEDDEEAEWRVESAWPKGANVLMCAGAKFGKTTTTGNVIRSLVDGDRLFQLYPVNPVTDGMVALLDFEMPRTSVKRWLRDQGIQNQSLVTVWTMRGKAGLFDPRDPTVRARWVERLRESAVKVWIIDCLSPILGAFGINENDNTEVGRILDGIATAATEAGVDEVLLIHHMGHGAERSRGASRLIDWPDVSWRLILQRDEQNPTEVKPDAPRFFAAYGRDVDIREGRLLYDPVTRHLTYVEGGRKNTEHTQAMGRVLVYVRDNPGLSGDSLIKKLTSQGLGRNDVRKAIGECETKGYVVVKEGQRRAKLHEITGMGIDAIRQLAGLDVA